MIYRVWQRHRDVFLRLWRTDFIEILGEPLVAYVAVAVGFSFYLKEVLGVPYGQFVAPGLVCAYAMFAATFENTFGSFMRLVREHTFDGFMATPMTVHELVMGEILWGSTRALMTGTAVLALGVAFGFIVQPTALLIVPLCFLVGLVFASLAMCMAAIAPAFSTLGTYFTVFITPMFFLSGIFFPVDNFPVALRVVAWFLPLTHISSLARGFALHQWELALLLNLGVLLLFLAVFLPLSVRLMKRRLVR